MNLRLVVADEPGAWSSYGGSVGCGTAITTAVSGRRQQLDGLLHVGTLAPAPLTGIGVDGGRTFVEVWKFGPGKSRLAVDQADPRKLVRQTLTKC